MSQVTGLSPSSDYFCRTAVTVKAQVVGAIREAAGLRGRSGDPSGPVTDTGQDRAWPGPARSGVVCSGPAREGAG